MYLPQSLPLLFVLAQHSVITTHLVRIQLKTSGGRAVERRTVNRQDGGSIPPAAVSKLRQFRSPHICLYLSEGTLNAGGLFYLVSVQGEVKAPTQGVKV